MKQHYDIVNRHPILLGLKKNISYANNLISYSPIIRGNLETLQEWEEEVCYHEKDVLVAFAPAFNISGLR